MPRSAFRRRALSLTPLVDVIFLLLLFFMLTSTFSRYGEIEIAAASGGGSNPADRMQFLQLGEDRLRLAGQEVAMSALSGRLAGATLLVSLDGEVRAQRLIDLMAVLRGVPDLSLTVLR